MRRRRNGAEESRADLKQLKSLKRYFRPYRGQIAAAIAALVITSGAVLGMGGALRYLIDEGIGRGDVRLLNRSFIIALGVVALLAVASYARLFLVAWLGEKVVADIRRDVYRKLVSMHMGFFEKARTGELLSRLTTDTTLLQTVITGSASMALRNAIMLFGGCAMLLVTSPHLTAYILLLVPLVVVPIIMLGRRVRRHSRETQDRVADISAQGEETLYGIRTIQAFALEEYETQRFEQVIQRVLRAGFSRIRTKALLTSVVISLVFGAIMGVLWMGGRDVLAGRMTSGDLSAFVFYSAIMAGAIGGLSDVMGDLHRAAGSAERLGELLSMEPLIASPSSVRGEGWGGGGPAQDAPSLTLPPAGGGEIAFSHLSFIYPARPDKPAVHDFNLDVASGQTIALVGPSGAGKSTIFQLLLRFYDPTGGTILLNGIDLRQWPLPELRGLIGIVPQDPIIFSGTARENIRLGNIRATDEEVMQAARAASALEFLEKLPYGPDSYLGEKGVQLSGGQKQRIAIARAVIRNPRLLLLDEATSALDSENELYIRQALEELMQGRTTFVIAHRLSTIVRADRIVLMNEGYIEATGTHRELLADSPLYRRLAELQFKTDS
ncbi:MAG: ATP-binding cassette domain-containing protein [Pseudomonadota bacterium]|nr:ATP-binding cassette domain-containing protein [Pseudomonadota bacterium]